MSGTHAPPCLVAGCARALMLVACLGWSMQGVAKDETHERERIASERAQVHAEFAARQHECQARFAVTSCVNAARSHRREALDRLRREELLLDEARRRQRAAGRVAEIRDRVSADEARERKALVAPPAPASLAPAAAPSGPRATARAPAQRSPHPKARAGPVDRLTPDAAAQGRDDLLRQAREARHTAEFEARTRAARAHREEVERRNAVRAAQGRRAAPLPASAPAS